MSVIFYNESNYKTYWLQTTESPTIMASSLSNLAGNFAKKIHKVKCKYRHDNNKCETYGIKYKDWECCVEYTKVKDDLIEWKGLCCYKYYQKGLMIYKRTNFLINT